jgi:hypothetical protein
MIVDSHQPYSDELIRHVFDCLETDNLPVKVTAVCSGLAPDDHHQGHTGLLCFRPTFIE